jgi:hypothetical protein
MIASAPWHLMIQQMPIAFVQLMIQPLHVPVLSILPVKIAYAEQMHRAMIASAPKLLMIQLTLIVFVQLMIQPLHVPVLSILPVKTATAELMLLDMIVFVPKLALIQATSTVSVPLMIKVLLVPVQSTHKVQTVIVELTNKVMVASARDILIPQLVPVSRTQIVKLVFVPKVQPNNVPVFSSQVNIFVNATIQAAQNVPHTALQIVILVAPENEKIVYYIQF